MAGFADEVTKFNPYVPEVPVDDYVNVGLQLQRRYDEGVQRTQSAIDNVAGLQVAGEANTEYLRSKVSQLETQTNKIAGSDFAKNSVNTQVGQLAGQIYRDPVIQAGMTSAVRLQNYDKNWSDLEKNHPEQYSAQNKEYYDQYVNDYMKQSQTKAGLVYNGPTDAVAHVNYYDDIDAELKKLDPNITTTISPAGEFMYKVDKNSTVSREQIDGVINSKMLADPRIQNQMQIDAWHSYRSFDGMQMFDHVNKSFGSMIDSYKGYAKYYQDQIKANPNDYQTISGAQKKILDFNTEVQSLSSNRDNYLKALNEGKLDDVKQSVFNDSIRQGLILKYERNNVTTDLKNNENAIQAYKNKFEEEHLGIERTNSERSELEYELKLKEFQMKLKAGEFGGQTFSVAGNVGADYTEDAHNSAITNTEAQISDYQTRLRSLPGKANLSDAQWGSYLATQEAKYQNPDPKNPVDSDYALYRSKTQVLQALDNTFKSISKGIYTKANADNPIGGLIPQSADFQNITVKDENGQYRSTKIHADQGTIAAAVDVYQTASQTLKNWYSNATPGQSPPAAFLAKVYDDAAQKYKGDPNYKNISGLARSNEINQYSEATVQAQSNRNASIASQYKDFGKTVSYQATPLAGKPEEINYYKRLATGSSNEQGVAVDFDKMEPISQYTDDQGRAVIQYQDKGKTEMHTVIVPASQNKLTNPDPYQPIQRIIDLSPDKSTPTDPKQALSTTNGKLKYILAENKLSGDLTLSIWSKGVPYTIPSFDVNDKSFTKPNIGSFVDRLEQISRMGPQQKVQFLAQLTPEDRQKWGDVLGLN